MTGREGQGVGGTMQQGYSALHERGDAAERGHTDITARVAHCTWGPIRSNRD